MNPFQIARASSLGALLVLIPSLAVARPNLHLVINNKDPNLRTFDITATIGTRQATSIGRLDKNVQTIIYDLPISNGNTLVLKANFPNSAIVDSQSFTVQNSDTTHTFDVTVTGGRAPDGEAAFIALFSNMGQPRGFGNYALSKALTDLLGGIALVSSNDSDTGTAPTVIHAYSIAKAMNKAAIDPNAVHFTGSSDNETADVDSSVSAKGAITLAFLGSLQVGFSSARLNESKAHFVNMGQLTASPQWDLGSAIDAMKGSTELKLFCSKAKSRRNAQILFVDRLYGVENAEFSTKSSDSVDTTTALTSNMVVSGDAAYSYKAENFSDKLFSSQVLNADGSPYAVSDVCGPTETSVATIKIRKGSGDVAHVSEAVLRGARTVQVLYETPSMATIKITRVIGPKERIAVAHPDARQSISGSFAHAFMDRL